MKKKIKQFFNCVATTWICKLYLATIVLTITATYTGQVMDTSLEYTWYSLGVSYLFGASVIYISGFILVLTCIGIYNWVKAKINGDK